MKQKGFAGIVILVVVLIIAGLGGAYYFGKFQTPKPQTQNPVVVSSPPQPTGAPSPRPDETANPDSIGANWKIYTDKGGLFEISYPGNWIQGESGGTVTFGDQRIDIDIVIWNDGSKEYVEDVWAAVGCGGNDPNGGCAPIQNKEVKKIVINNNLVYFKVDGGGQMHAYIPNTNKDKMIEIYSVFLSDRKLFDQILATFKFTQ